MSGPAIRIAVDIGGTFTDIQALDSGTGEAWAFKVPTTPSDPSVGLLAGIRGAAERFGFAVADVAFILHGTTIATNAVLQGALPAGALVATAGFEDVLEIGRHLRKDVYGLKAEHRPVLVPRQRRFGLAERVRADGTVAEPVDAGAARALAQRLAAEGVASLAVCLLHAYANPAHERAVREIVAAAAPGLAVSLSSEVSPEIREFERSSTTVLNALLVPVVQGYLSRIEARLAEAGVAARLYLVQSNGGVTTPATAAEQPVRLLLSGPSGGAMALQGLAGSLAEPNLVGVDMGGTSSDVSVIRDGRATVVTEGEIAALPVRVPMLEIRSIGAGGGSIAAVEPGGGLRVGPRSAGAEPGPVCYGRGGVEPTVTDANVALGRLDPDYFLGGAIRLDRAAAERAIADRVAGPLGLPLAAAAEGIVAVANANMAAAVRLSLFEKGSDPRDFALVPFGGAGGLHAVALAEELDMRRVVFPRDPATLSARGILLADIAHDVGRSRLMPLAPASLPALRRLAGELRAAGEALLDRDGIPPDRRTRALAADLRYRGQAFELLVPWGDVTPDEATLATLLARFHGLHQERFAHSNPDDPVELVTLRVQAVGHLAKPAARPFRAQGTLAPKGRRRLVLDGTWVEAPVYDRAVLAAGQAVAGPLLVEEEYTTMLVPAGWSIEAAATGDLVATRTP